LTFKITTIGWWGAYPDANEASSGYLIKSEDYSVLIDCGSGVLSRLQNYIALQDLDAVVLSHYHWDHVADIGCLQYAARIAMDLGRRENPLPIYGHAEDDNLKGLTYLQYSQGHAIDTRTPLRLGNLSFRFGRNVHPDPCFSMRVEKSNRTFVYIADTEYTDNLIEIARGADLLLCESSLYDEYQGNRYSHACPFARIMEDNLAVRLIQAGIRTANTHQREQAEKFGMNIPDFSVSPDEVVSGLEDPLYISLDLDVLDPAFAPGVSHYEPGGLSTRQVLDIIHRIDVRIVGADIVEYNPSRDINGLTAMTAAKFVKEIGSMMINNP